jgi:hypothetical protein
MKGFLIEKLTLYYNETIDSFVGICSKYLPAIQQFLQFWNETIEYDETEIDYEIEEITFLFRKWCEIKNEVASNLNDKQFLDLIAYYYPDIEIERDKFICKIKCNLWDKQLDIQVALESMKQQLLMQLYRDNGSITNYERLDNPVSGRNVSIYDSYKYYSKYFSSIPNRQIVNKSYFERYINDYLTDYVLDSKFIGSDWLVCSNV